MIMVTVIIIAGFQRLIGCQILISLLSVNISDLDENTKARFIVNKYQNHEKPIYVKLKP